MEYVYAVMKGPASGDYHMEITGIYSTKEEAEQAQQFEEEKTIIRRIPLGKAVSISVAQITSPYDEK